MCFCTVQFVLVDIDCVSLGLPAELRAVLCYVCHPVGAALPVVLLLCVGAVVIGRFRGTILVVFVEIELWHVYSIASVIIVAGLGLLALVAHRSPVHIDSKICC